MKYEIILKNGVILPIHTDLKGVVDKLTNPDKKWVVIGKSGKRIVIDSESISAVIEK